MGAFSCSIEDRLRAHHKTEGEADQHQHDGAEKCWDEAANVKSRNKGAGQQQDDGVDDQEEKSEGQNADRESQQFQEKSQGGIQEADDKGRDQRAAEAG